ncbi:mRNA decay activator protein zfp36 [Datura stramonium]|uniref:mRNA decay activator protein zfp36 n=1 Tax=Datura stramonium TaxID=4076 RepID=A0ABS8SW75_DATST|nr:mRNA decay activator protein zfp36 [Datura stramonium]
MRGSTVLYVEVEDIVRHIVIEECDLDVDVENIVRHKESMLDVDESNSDCYNSDTGYEEVCDYSDYDSEELEFIAKERKRVVNERLSEYKELHKSMTFKDIEEARRFISLHALTNDYNLTIQKSFLKRFRVVCQRACNFICLISGQKHCSDISMKTLTGKHKCENPCGNYKVGATTIAYYFKEKLQDNPKYKIQDMRVDLKIAFNINASFGKCKRAKIMILEKMVDSFSDDYKRLAGYSNTLMEGLIEAVRTVLPDAMHRFCMRHIEANWRKKGKKFKQMTKLLWWFSWSTYKEELDDHLKSLAELLEETKEDPLHFPIQTWCRVYFDTVCKNQKVPTQSKHFFTKGLIPLNKYTDEEAMESPPFVKLVDKLTVKRKRDKDEALKRQSEWVASRKGRVMTCSSCRIPGHNARGYEKDKQPQSKKEKQTKKKRDKQSIKDKQPKKDKQPMKRKRRLIDEEDEEPSLPSPPRFPDDATVEDLHLTAPQPS